MANHLRNAKTTIIVLMLISSAFVVASSATEGATLSTTSYRYETINGTEVRITDYIGQGGVVAIPDSLGGKPVTEIGDSAFSDSTRITSVSIPSTVRLIDDYAFAYSDMIASVVIGSNVSVIGNYSFFHCISLSSISVPSSVSYIGSSAFADCTIMASIDVNSSNAAYSSVSGVLYDKAHSILIQCPSGKVGPVTIENGVTSIGAQAFYSCRLMTSVAIPNTVSTIEFEAFYYCNGLTSVTIPASVTYLSFAIFYSCSSMTSISVDLSNPSFSSIDGVLYNKAATTLIQYPIGRTGAFTVPGGVTSIGSMAFYNCANLTSVTIPNGVTRIDSYAFQNCKSLTSVSIPGSVTVIAYQAFSACISLTSVTIPNGVTTLGGYVFAYCEALTSINVPSSVASIGDMVFGYCNSLTGISVDPGSLMFAGIDGVLYNKATTTLIAYPAGKQGAFTVPETVKTIKDRAFSNCDALTSVVIGSNVTVIGNYTFYYCTDLKSVVISNSVSYIGNSAFYYCRNMTSLSLGTNVTTIGVEAFNNCNSLTAVTIPGKTSSIGAQAFGTCQALSSIGVADGNIKYSSDDGVLYDKNVSTLIQCPGGRSGAVTIPANVTRIEERAFSGCSRLASVTIPSGTTEIGDGAFSGCYALSSIEVPSSVTSIGDGAFSGLTSLDHIDVKGGNKNYASVNGVLFDKKVDTLIAFPCAKTGYFAIPKSVTKIGDSAFFLCNLTSVIIPSSVAEIGERAFTSCHQLTQMQFDGNTPICDKDWVSSENAALKISYINGTSEFTSPTWFGVTTVAMFPVTGNIVDVNGKGLANLTVALENGASVITEANGSFTIHATPGTHSLSISGAGIDRRTVEAKVTGTGLAMGNIVIGNNGLDLGLLILILIGAIAIILVLVMVLMKRRRGRTPTVISGSSTNKPWKEEPENQPPKVDAPSQSGPVGTAPGPSQDQVMGCPNCGTATNGTPFCGNCGKKLDEQVQG